MDRRSAVGTIAGALAGLSLGAVPSLEAGELQAGEPFSVTDANLARSPGIVTCPICREMSDSLELTPAGLCLRCADLSPTVRTDPHSDTFWILSPREIPRIEREIQRISAQLERVSARLSQLKQRQIEEGSDVFDRAMEAGRDEWLAIQRELHLLQLLRAASRQFSV